MKGVGMLVVLLRGINFGFGSHLGCSGQIFSRKGLVQGCTRKNIKYIFDMYIFSQLYLLIHIIQFFSFVCVLTWSLLGVKKSSGHAQIGLLQGFNSKFPTRIPTPFICGVPSPGHDYNAHEKLRLINSRCGQWRDVAPLRAKSLCRGFSQLTIPNFEILHAKNHTKYPRKKYRLDLPSTKILYLSIKNLNSLRFLTRCQEQIYNVFLLFLNF